VYSFSVRRLSGGGLGRRALESPSVCLWNLPPRPGSDVPCNAQRARSSDAHTAACDRGVFLFGSSSMLRDNRAAVLARNRCQFDHWMLLLLCACLLAFPGHGMLHAQFDDLAVFLCCRDLLMNYIHSTALDICIYVKKQAFLARQKTEIWFLIFVVTRSSNG
jgi:hypothetical protein